MTNAPNGKVALIPPEKDRCQAIITPGHGPFRLGPRPRPAQCTAKPTVIVTECEPGEDGQRGSMSLCGPCLCVMLDQLGPDKHIVEAIR